MRYLGTIGTAAAFVFLGAAPPVSAQPGAKGGKHDEKRANGQGKPDKPRGGPDKHARQEQPQRGEQEARAWQQQRGWLKSGGAWQGRDTWQKSRAQRWYSDHRTWAQRGGYGGYYIPADRFSLHFGSGHSFRIRTRPVIHMGYPRFEYSGFSFLLVDPWPEYWPDNWYENDDVYIDYDDGYYLHNRDYPQVRLAITVTL